MAVPRLTVPAPVALKIALSPSTQVAGEAQFALDKSHKELAEALFQVLSAAWLCIGASAASIRLAARSEVYLFIVWEFRFLLLFTATTVVPLGERGSLPSQPETNPAGAGQTDNRSGRSTHG